MATNPYQSYWSALGSKNYGGSSGYWGDLGTGYTGSRAGMGYAGDRARNSLAAESGLTPQAAGTSPDSWDASTSDYGVQKSDGRTYSAKTGQLWNGLDSKSGKTYTNGLEAGSEAAFNDRYKARDVIKDPVVAAAADDLSAQFTKSANDSLSDYNAILDQYKSQAARATEASNKATDIGGTEAALTGAQQDYANRLNGASRDYRDLNANDATTQRGFVTQAYNELPEYDTALEAQKQQALAESRAQMSRYGLSKNAGAGGANLGLGSDEAAIAAREAYRASLPYNLAKITRKQQILQDIAIPTQRDITNRETTRIGSFEPSVAGQIYQSSQATNQAIQTLRSAAASQDWQTMQQIMNVPELAAQVRQRILQGDTQLLAAIAQLRANSRYQGLEDTQGVNVTQPQYFSQATPGYGGYNTPNVGGGTRTYSGGGDAFGGARGGATASQNGITDLGNGMISGSDIDPATGGYRYNPIQTGYTPVAGRRTYSPGIGQGNQAGWTWDSATQTYRDASGNTVYADNSLPISASGED